MWFVGFDISAGSVVFGLFWFCFLLVRVWNLVVLMIWSFDGFGILVRIMMFEFGVGWEFCEICYLGVFPLFMGGLLPWFSVLVLFSTCQFGIWLFVCL